jgi:hypothetical protein
MKTFARIARRPDFVSTTSAAMRWAPASISTAAAWAWKSSATPASISDWSAAHL